VAACYRLFRGKYSPADAIGSYLAGGRWNPKGIHMLYASSTLSLACLEILVHIKEPRFPFDLQMGQDRNPCEVDRRALPAA
jgi:RES domain-containing protein